MDDLEKEFSGAVLEEFKVKENESRGALLEEFKVKYNTNRAPARAITSTPLAQSQTARHYGSDELKRIGDVCSTRLPPASAVQAMFAYELQRQSEVESLFQGSLFRLSQAEDTSTSHEARIAKLEAQLQATQHQLQVLNIQDQLTASKARVSTQQATIDECAAKLDAHNTRLTDMARKITAFAAAKAEGEKPATTIAQLLEEVTVIHAEVDTLFNERDAMIAMLKDSGDRITKLEDAVRALTLQLSSTSARGPPAAASAALSPATAHKMPAPTANGGAAPGTQARPTTEKEKDKENRAPPSLNPWSLPVPAEAAPPPPAKSFVPHQTFVPGQQRHAANGPAHW
ncbi:hypothetical protein LTR08_000432 [Meristemomyces frigidus]|nr:hypothetical protein LTR08_000432 [Meristemomyces frigidus]